MSGGCVQVWENMRWLLCGWYRDQGCEKVESRALWMIVNGKGVSMESKGIGM